MPMTELNVGFSRRELKLLESAGFAASLLEKPDEWLVFLHDARAPQSDVVALGSAPVRLDALRDAISKAETLPRCECGGACSTRFHACVRCGASVKRAEGTYAAWITEWVANQRLIRGRCASATTEMVETFPELKRVAGWVYGAKTAPTEHFWCVSPDGSIVDPSASQFAGELTYREFRPGDSVCVGRCMNCGDYIYAQVERLDNASHRQRVCSDACERALQAQLSFKAFQARGPVT
jgi:hypothetical protein